MYVPIFNVVLGVLYTCTIHTLTERIFKNFICYLEYPKQLLTSKNHKLIGCVWSENSC